MAPQIPISTLKPSALTSEKSIQGVITLVWPFSQSSQTCAVLLAAEDFRQRAKRGQVRITFSGAAAKAVAESKAGISDKLVVSLKGAKWLDSTDVRTPGKSIDGELLFKETLDVTVTDVSGVTRQLSVDDAATGRGADIAEVVPSTPAALQQNTTHRLSSTVKDSFGSPAFLRKTHSTADLIQDPFFDMDDQEQPRKRLRTSLGEVRSWRYAEHTPSPVQELDHHRETGRSTSLQQDTPSRLQHPIFRVDPEPASLLMQPPPVPSIVANPVPVVSATETGSHDGAPVTPKLNPVSALTLPLPSPFPNEAMSSLFDLAVADASIAESGKDMMITNGNSTHDKVLADSTEEMATISGGHISTTPQVQHAIVPSEPVLSGADHPQTDDIVKHENRTTARHVPTRQFDPQEEREREQTRRQILSSLFGIQSSSTEVPTASSIRTPQSHQRTLSEFEMVGSQAMEDVGSQTGRSQTMAYDGDSHDLGNLLPHRAPDQDGTSSLQSVKCNNANEDLDVVLPSNNGTSADHHVRRDHSLSPEVRNFIVDTSDEDLPESHTPIPPVDKEMTHVNQLWTSEHTEYHLDNSVESLRSSSEISSSLQNLDTSIIHANQPTHTTMEERWLPRRQLTEQELEEFSMVSKREIHKPVVRYDDSPITQPSRQTDHSAIATFEHGPRKSSILTKREQIPTKGTPFASFPPILSKWLISRETPSNEVVEEAIVTNEAVPSSAPDRAGLQTSLSYFTALARLAEHINAARTVDVFGIVMHSRNSARRQSNAPEDFYLTLRIADDTLPERTTVPVFIYRPHQASLPTAALGDVILLRGFTVKSRNHKPFLRSTNESAWCVWRYSELYSHPEGMAANGGENQPPGRLLPVEADLREEVLGPPIEYGDEERVEATRLSRWLLSPAAFQTSSEIVDVSSRHVNQIIPRDIENWQPPT